MKNIYRIFTILALTGLFTSCLDEEPKYSQNSSVIFGDEDNAELALLGCYGRLTQNNSYGQMWQEVPINGSGLAWAQRNASDNDDLASLSVSINNSEVYSAWSGMYTAIAEINSFIEGMEDSSISSNVKLPYIGEARFLRALCHYNLVSHFGKVPLKLKASTSDGIACERSELEEIFDAIIEDLEYAQENMETSCDPGRACSWTARAMLGKVYYKMAMLKISGTEIDIDSDTYLNLAKEVFDDVYNNGPYSLDSHYKELFIPYTESDYVSGSSESIFQLNFNSSSTVCFNRGSNRFAPQASTSGINWGTVRAAKYGYDLLNGTYPGDPRLEANYLVRWRTRSGNSQANPSDAVRSDGTLFAGDSTYAYPYRAYSGGTDSTIAYRLPYELFADPTCPTQDEIKGVDSSYVSSVYGDLIREMINDGHFKRKYPQVVVNITTVIGNMYSNYTTNGSANNWPFFGKIYDQGQQAQRSNQNLIVYRYAELLLEMADVYNELGYTTEAINIANQVLTRARNLGESGQPANWSTSLTKDEVTEKLYFERIFELIGEPNLYDMVRIRGTEYLNKLLVHNNKSELVQGSAEAYYDDVQAFSERVFDEGQTDQLSESFLKKNLLLPIPSEEIAGNSAITDNNYGY